MGHTSSKTRTIRAMRKRVLPPRVPAPEPELSNYELIERRSRELEIEHANGGPGTSQPPDAETPLLFSRPSGQTPARRPSRTRTSRARTDK
jgi:hypothetical protein